MSVRNCRTAGSRERPMGPFEGQGGLLRPAELGQQMRPRRPIGLVGGGHLAADRIQQGEALRRARHRGQRGRMADPGADRRHQGHQTPIEMLDGRPVRPPGAPAVGMDGLDRGLKAENGRACRPAGRGAAVLGLGEERWSHRAGSCSDSGTKAPVSRSRRAGRRASAKRRAPAAPRPRHGPARNRRRSGRASRPPRSGRSGRPRRRGGARSSSQTSV